MSVKKHVKNKDFFYIQIQSLHLYGGTEENSYFRGSPQLDVNL
jgi:hypothetical protein